RQPAERRDDLALELVGVEVVVTGDERVADVIERVAQEAVQWPVVENGVAGVTDEGLRLAGDAGEEIVEALLVVGRQHRFLRVVHRHPAGETGESWGVLYWW